MNQNPNPYDNGTRLEPKPWVQDGTAGSDDPRPATLDDYGRVDFDNDEGATELTVWATPTEDGIVLRVDSMSDTPITIETEADRLTRETQVASFHDKLEALATEAHDYVTWDDEGDPSAFSPGHYELASFDPEGEQFYVELTYTGTNPYDDEAAVPTGATWHTRSLEYDGHGSRRQLCSPNTSVPISEAETVVAAAREWVTAVANKHTQYVHTQTPQQYVDVRVSGPSLS